jgi:serine phosphatase RsbU (regulator of sigma subunit)/glyoxylase-like metal-dependent hydrolase (beta-lactamase superfamily II)
LKSKYYDNPVQVSEHVYWVGTYDDCDNFQCNAYLIVLNGDGIIIDPGSVLYFEDLIRKVTQKIPLKNISYVIAQHQDPDVCGNVAQLINAIIADGGKNCKVVAHSRTSILIRHYGIGATIVHSNHMPRGRLLWAGDRQLEFIHTPYLHSPGAIATYFPEDRVLFSSDIFGGVMDNWQLFASDNYLEKVTKFHQEYMPAKEFILYAMTKFERYDIDMIAPQHGSILNKTQSADMIEAFKTFECGLFIDQAFRDELESARKLIETQNEIMNRELSMAGQFQKSLLPDKSEIKKDPRVDIAYFFEPHSQVSGDFLIVDRIDADHLGVMVIDVVDHGVTSGLATIQLKTLFDEYKTSSTSPAQVLATINEKAFSISENDIFLTVSYAIFDFKESVVTIASAGGIPAIFFRAQKNESELLWLVGTPLGICEADECQIGEERYPFEKNDVVILQTDGLLDCTNAKNQAFDSIKSQRKLTRLISGDMSAQQMLKAFIDTANRHKGKDKGFDDDVTIVVIKL